MSTANDFDALRRKVLVAYHQDGILDLVAGAVLLGFGFNMLTDNIVFLTLGWLGFPLYFILKQRITTPRFGYVQFLSKQKSQLQYWVLAGVGLLVLLVFVAGGFSLNRAAADPEMQRWLLQYHMAPLSALLFGLPACLAAFLLGVKRFYLYALLAVGLPVLGAMVHFATYLPILIFGLVMVLWGLWLLLGFMRQYRPDHEAGGRVSG